MERRFAGRSATRRPGRARPGTCPPPEVTRRSTEQAHLCVGLRALTRDDPDRYALAVLNQVLGGGMSSRLFQEIREKRGLAYSVYSYRAAYLGPGPRRLRRHRARQAHRCST